MIIPFGDFGFPDELSALVFTPLPKFSLLSLFSSLDGGIDLEELLLVQDGFKFVTGVFLFPMFFENLKILKNNRIYIYCGVTGSGLSNSLVTITYGDDGRSQYGKSPVTGMFGGTPLVGGAP